MGKIANTKYKIQKKSQFIQKCDQINKVIEFEQNEFVRRDINQGPYHHLNRFQYSIYPLNLKSTILSLMQTSSPQNKKDEIESIPPYGINHSNFEKLNKIQNKFNMSFADS